MKHLYAVYKCLMNFSLGSGHSGPPRCCAAGLSTRTRVAAGSVAGQNDPSRGIRAVTDPRLSNPIERVCRGSVAGQKDPTRVVLTRGAGQSRVCHAEPHSGALSPTAEPGPREELLGPSGGREGGRERGREGGRGVYQGERGLLGPTQEKVRKKK